VSRVQREKQEIRADPTPPLVQQVQEETLGQLVLWVFLVLRGQREIPDPVEE